MISLLKESSNQIQGIEKYNKAYEDLSERLKSVLIEIKDIAQETAAYEQEIIFNPSRIEEINERLNTIYTLQQKHRVSNLEELLALQNQLSDNLQTLLNSDEEIEKLEQTIAKSALDLDKMAATLSANRTKAIKIVEGEVSQTLTKVGMPNAKIKIEKTASSDLNKDGKDNIALLFTANAGQPPAPVGKVASGGELSRLMLSIKSILAKNTALPTLIFDEIDTGISGETAVRVGNVIGELEHNMQVICITHLPQIAAKGDAHYFVYKNEESARSTTGIKRLKHEERVVAIAEMLSGKDPGASALENAKDLLASR